MRHHPITAICAVCVASAFGQNPNGPGGNARKGTPPEIALRPVIGAPYSGEEIGEHVQTQADGTRVTSILTPTKLYRDSAGRTRREWPLSGNGAQVAIEITDPVAHIKYTLDTVNKVAHRQQLARKFIARLETFEEGTALRTTTVKLGHRTIEGVLTEGTRLTTTWPANSRGNDRPISVVRETWTSPGLQITLLGKATDPRIGEETWQLTNVDLGEPPANLFKPPHEYKVVDETGEFTITRGARH